MHSILPIAGVVLALISAGCVAYIAWEVTSDLSEEKSDDKLDEKSGKSDSSDSERS